MQIEREEDGEIASQRAAEFIESTAQESIARSGTFSLALSGGRTPERMLDFLADSQIEWQQVHLFQVDERIAPDGDSARNLTQLNQHLLDKLAFPPRFEALPVDAQNPEAAASEFARLLPNRFDLIHLGLGTDGHIASLVPGDDTLEADLPVALTSVYQGHRRLTLTLPVLNAARNVLMLVTGADKRDALSRLLNRDPTIPASALWPERFLIVTDREAFD